MTGISAVLMLALLAPAEVMPCHTWARMVEAIAGMAPEQQAAVPANIRRWSQDPQHIRMVLLAHQYVTELELTADEAYPRALAYCGGEDA